MSRRPERERGAGTLMVAGICVALALVTLCLAAAASYLVARHRAEAAADLAALAGARAVVAAGFPAEPDAVACDAAATAASNNQATLDGCSVVAFARYVAVTAEVSVPAPLSIPGLPDHLAATARAGNPGDA